MSATLRAIRRVTAKAPVAYAPSSGIATQLTPQPAGGLEAYSAVSTLFSVVHQLASSVASTEWYMCETPTQGRARYRSDEEREITRHPALDTWNNPNDHMSQRELVETYIQHAELVGDSFLDIETLGLGFPVELWPLRPDLMTPVPSREDYLAGWQMRGVDGQTTDFDPAEILQYKHGPHPTNPYRGMGPVATLLWVLGSHQAAQIWNAMFFQNGATPRGYWSIDDSLDQPDFDEFTVRLREQHKGARNAHRDIVADNGAKYTPISISAKDLQLVEQFGINADMIREAYGVSKTMLGVAESETNRATAETAEYVFAKYRLVERLDKIKDILNQRFLPLYGTSARGAEFRYRNPVPADEEGERAERDSRVAAASAAIDKGADPAAAYEAYELPEMVWAAKPAASAPALEQDPEPAPA